MANNIVVMFLGLHLKISIIAPTFGDKLNSYLRYCECLKTVLKDNYIKTATLNNFNLK